MRSPLSWQNTIQHSFFQDGQGESLNLDRLFLASNFERKKDLSSLANKTLT